MESQDLPFLRPLRLGELLDQAIRLYRANFLTFIGIIAVIYVPLMILQTALTTLMSRSLFDISPTASGTLPTNFRWIGALTTIAIAFIQVFLVQGIATGALARAVADNYLGKKTGILEAYKGISKSWASLLGALLFIGLMFILITLWWLIVPCIGWFTGAGMMMFLGAAVSPLVAPSVVLEGQGAIASLSRAWNLARRRFWPVLGYVFVLYLFSVIIVNGPSAIVDAILTSVLQPFGDPAKEFVFVTIAQSLVALVATLIYYPLQMTAFTLIYFDLRVRTEGFDLALLTMDTSNAVDGSQYIPAPPSATKERLITGAELGNFAILTLAAAGIYILFISLFIGGAYFFSSLF